MIELLESRLMIQDARTRQQPNISIVRLQNIISVNHNVITILKQRDLV